MKSPAVLLALSVLTHASLANAASLSVTMTNTSVAIYLAGETHNGMFNTIIFEATPPPAAPFNNQSSGRLLGVPFPAGQPFSYRNRMIDLDPIDTPDTPGALGWAVIGVTQTATRLSFVTAQLGYNISTATMPGGKLFLANLNMPATYSTFPPGNVNVRLQDATGNDVALLSTYFFPPFPVPEPASGMMLAIGTGLLVVVAARRGPLQSESA